MSEKFHDMYGDQTTGALIALAVEALECEVNNAGYNQFFMNSSREFVDVIEPALLANAARIIREAIAALYVGEPTAEKGCVFFRGTCGKTRNRSRLVLRLAAPS